MSDVKFILTGARPCHVPLFSHKERNEVLWQDDVSSLKRNFIQDTPHGANFEKMLKGSEM